jgi:hypothetical protein
LESREEDHGGYLSGADPIEEKKERGSWRSRQSSCQSPTDRCSTKKTAQISIAGSPIPDRIQYKKKTGQRVSPRASADRGIARDRGASSASGPGLQIRSGSPWIGPAHKNNSPKATLDIAPARHTTESVCPLAPRAAASVCLARPCQLVQTVLLQFVQDFSRFLCDRLLGATQYLSDQY